jgi:hypothetical protein
VAERLRHNKPLPFILGIVIVGIVVAFALRTAVQEEVASEQPVVVQVTPEALVAKEEAALHSQSAPTPQAVHVAGTQVQVDPTTGKLIPPTLAQKKSLANALRKQFASDPYDPYYWADGTISFVVGTERLNFSVAHLNEKGLPEMSCVSGLEQAVSVLESGSEQPLVRAEE